MVAPGKFETVGHSLFIFIKMRVIYIIRVSVFRVGSKLKFQPRCCAVCGVATL